MITTVGYREDKGRLYADITREDVTVDNSITIVVTNSEGEHTHTKFLPPVGKSLTIDLTPYCKAYLTGKLSDALTAGIVAGLAKGLSVRVSALDPYYYIYGGHKHLYGILTKLPYLQVSRANNGKADYLHLGVCIPDDGEIILNHDTDYIELANTPDKDLLYATINGDNDNIVIADISDVYEGSEFLNNNIPVRTVPRGMNTRRLIWRNELGGIDAWSFEFLRESTFATTSDVFYSTLNGYTRTNRQYERVNIVETREVDDITANVLAYITASPEVYLWDYDTKKPIPVDIITEECRTYSDTELTSIQIAYRPKEREVL